MADLDPRVGQSDCLLQIEQIRDERRLTLRLRGELDLSSAPELKRLIDEFEAENADCLLIDLRDLEFMDSTGLAMMVSAGQAAQRNGHQLRLRAGSPPVQRLFELTGVLDRFTFEE
jgi:anti-sigma B factor antagonist